MSLRLVQIILPERSAIDVETLLDDVDQLAHWMTAASDSGCVLNVLIDVGSTESIIQDFEKRFAHLETFRVVLLPVEGTTPLPDEEEEEKEDEEAEDKEDKKEAKKNGPPISLEELYNDVTEGVEASPRFAITVALSAIVAAIGLSRGNVAVVVGAMIIAPLLGVSMTMTLGTALARGSLIWRGLRVNALALAVTAVVSILFGAIFPIDLSLAQNVTQLKIGFMELLLGAAAGAAGALSFVGGGFSGVVGVMVAIALLPPLVLAGMLLGSGRAPLSVGPALLSAANFICINLAGVVTFALQRVTPRRAYEEKRAKRSVWVALGLWLGLLAALVLILYVFRDYSTFP